MSDARLETLIRIAAEAAELVRQVYATSFAVEYKGPADPVTEADRRANELICERLAREFPGVPIVAEESDPASFARYREFPDVFFVDPVDGTNEFIDRNGEFVVMIGLVEGARATTSVLHAPAQQVAWAATLGRGAFRIDSNGSRSPIHVSEVNDVADVRLISSRSHRSERLERLLSALGARAILSMGSAGLKGVEVARGAADAQIAPYYAGKLWDACAVEALVTAAGGRVTNTHGEEIDYRAETLALDRGFLASNARVHDGLLKRIADYRAELAAL